MTHEEKVRQIMIRLYKVFPHPKTALDYRTPWELLVATILSAQATDKLVNSVTPELFKKFPTVKSMAEAPVSEIDQVISKINFHQNKAKLVKGSAEMVMEKYGGEVPADMEKLDALPGVARKTANVVLGNAFHKNEGIVVDTHVMRLSQKLGLTKQKDPVKIEQDLMNIVPREKWTDFGNLLILFGREYCPARGHQCADCPLGDLCPDK